jgi:hypothetical protein
MNNLKQHFMVWKMAIFKCANKAMITGLTTFITAMAGLRWSDLTGTEKTLIIFGMIIAMGNTVDSFLDRSISRIEVGLPPEIDAQIEQHK